MTEWAALGGHEMGRGRAVFGRLKRTRSSGKKGRLRKKKGELGGGFLGSGPGDFQLRKE